MFIKLKRKEEKMVGLWWYLELIRLGGTIGTIIGVVMILPYVRYRIEEKWEIGQKRKTISTIRRMCNYYVIGIWFVHIGLFVLCVSLIGKLFLYMRI